MYIATRHIKMKSTPAGSKKSTILFMINPTINHVLDHVRDRIFVVLIVSVLLCVSEPVCDISNEPKPLPPSCKEILARYPDTRSGYYLIQPRDGTPKIYLNCDMDSERCGTKGWTRVAHMNISKISQPCPVGFTLIESPIRSCGGLATRGCASVKFRTYGISYSQVCGRLRGYQVGHTDGFGPYVNDGDPDLVVDGILISHGETRQHIWAYATGYQKANLTLPSYLQRRLCPCHPQFNGEVPPFIGNDYYCDSGVESGPVDGQFYTTPLWTGEGCTPPDCCSHSGMPWFCKTLPVPTTDYIEVWNCHNIERDHESTALDLIELYIH